MSAESLLAGSREDRAYAAAMAAFQDKFYDRAAGELTQFLQNYRKSTNAPSARLLLAQSEFYLGKYSSAIARLTDTNNLAKAQVAGLTDRYIYWHAEAEFASGHLETAAQTFVTLGRDWPQSPLALSAVVEAAAAYEKLGRWPELDNLLDNTNGLFQHMAQRSPAESTVADGRLLQSESKYAQQDFAGAVRVLDLMAPAMLTPEQGWKRAHQLCRAYLSLDNLDAALSAATNAIGIARLGRGGSWSTNLAESVAYQANILEKEGQLDQASAAWQLETNMPAAFQQLAVLKIAEIAMAQANLSRAEDKLRDFVAKFPDAPAAGIARLTLGELHLKDHIAQPDETNHLTAAKAEFDEILDVVTNGPIAGKAYLDRGWCHWLAAEMAGLEGGTTNAIQESLQCLADFQSAAQLLPVSEEWAVARFKVGDAQFLLNNFASALTNYQAVLDDFPVLPKVAEALDVRVLYQILRTRLALREANGVEGTMAALLEKFSNNAPADSSLLLAGQGLSDFDSPAKARKLFKDFAVKRPDSSLLPEVEFAVGRTFEREANWLAAATNYENWLVTYSTNELRPQVEYARARAIWQSGNEPRAFQLFTNFISQYPGNTNAALAYWWVADHYFRLGSTNYQDAERSYQSIFEDFPKNSLAYPARLMAGRAAMGRFSYKDAASYLGNLIENSNAPAEMRLKAEFGYCEALQQMGASDTSNFRTATNILAQIVPMAATNVAGALAWSEIGDCNRKLGAYDTATNAYAQALNSPAVTADIFLMVHVNWGKTLEEKADGMPEADRKVLLQEALNHYQDVIYFQSDKPTDDFWVKWAGLKALPLVPADEARGKLIDRLESLLPAMKESLEKKRASLTKD
ncbi:MAG TPA: tetratricopeptide repeat protein [Verrucomicrobiae bacterium]